MMNPRDLYNKLMDVDQHLVAIEVDVDGDLVVACSCGAEMDLEDSYGALLADVEEWAESHEQHRRLSEMNHRSREFMDCSLQCNDDLGHTGTEGCILWIRREAAKGAAPHVAGETVHRLNTTSEAWQGGGRKKAVFTTSCVCGWRSGDCPTEQDARARFDHHIEYWTAKNRPDEAKHGLYNVIHVPVREGGRSLDRYEATCACGWNSPLCYPKDRATELLNEHVKEQQAKVPAPPFGPPVADLAGKLYSLRAGMHDHDDQFKVVEKRLDNLFKQVEWLCKSSVKDNQRLGALEGNVTMLMEQGERRMTAKAALEGKKRGRKG